jgi:peptidoglycan/LPS O-acetylase OafA/YrhL
VAAHLLYFWHLPYDWLGASWAVNIFCMISGFVISKLVTERSEPYEIYISRRFLRLWPVFILCSLFNILAEHKPFGELFIAHALMFQGLFFGESSVYYLKPSWSVSLEWQFYLIAPAFIALVMRLKRARWFLALGLAMYLPISGRLIWHWFMDYKNWYSCWPMGSMLYIRIGFFYIGILAYYYWPRLAGWQMPKWTQPLVYLGSISYVTYLVHWPILVLLSPRPNAGITIVLTVAASIMLHHWVEHPFIRLGKKLTVKTELSHDSPRSRIQEVV